jgi:hypothetical protein
LKLSFLWPHFDPRVLSCSVDAYLTCARTAATKRANYLHVTGTRHRQTRERAQRRPSSIRSIAHRHHHHISIIISAGFLFVFLLTSILISNLAVSLFYSRPSSLAIKLGALIIAQRGRKSTFHPIPSFLPPGFCTFGKLLGETYPIRLAYQPASA